VLHTYNMYYIEIEGGRHRYEKKEAEKKSYWNSWHNNQKFVVFPFKLQQACDSKHHFIFINSIQGKHLSQIPHHWISASSNHHTLQWHRIKSQMHSING
jgi:hypothetical protein